jgi:hypothetical protein
MGDLFEVATKTSIGRGVYDEAYPTQKQYTKGAEIFKPYNDIIDATIEGNHEERIIRDTSFEIMEEFADKIRCPEAYSKFDAIVNYSVGDFTYSTYCWHGATGGTTEAAITNAMLKMRERALSHVYLMAHSHKLFHIERRVYLPNPGSDLPKELEQMFVNTGTCLGEGGYGVQKGLPLPVCGFGAVELFASERKMIFHKIKDLL